MPKLQNTDIKVGDVFELKGSTLKYVRKTDDFCDIFEVIERANGISRSYLSGQLFRWFYKDYKRSHLDFSYNKITEQITIRQYVPELQDDIKGFKKYLSWL